MSPGDNKKTPLSKYNEKETGVDCADNSKYKKREKIMNRFRIGVNLP